MKKADAKIRKERWAQEENTMRFRKETIEWKDDSTNLSRTEQVVGIQTKDGVHTSNYTQTRHRKNAITRMPPLRGVITTEYMLWEYTETTRERERKETKTTKEVWTDGTGELKRLIEYSKKIGLFHGI
jgi:hypothetical protein